MRQNVNNNVSKDRLIIICASKSYEYSLFRCKFLAFFSLTTMEDERHREKSTWNKGLIELN